ncbi:MAG: sel1 repeat family protein [Alphaproteobacteria bacterium]|nr:sel1 repeat family protein [Alphaproteobacteria bacterium]MBP7758215.1 sel1 repeat family protein [Alphaproteobacteria bacterium]MBP7761642.1 sel1 repeat family protein [Alphaproteobacteria bacterium]MBP7904006.1 sel1 repeat family protein [Alphaproteobacteria bacterium]
MKITIIVAVLRIVLVCVLSFTPLAQSLANSDKLNETSKPSLKFYEIENQAKQGSAEAQFLLGGLYASDTFAENNGVLKDYTKAEQWFRKAADQGHAEAQSYLGIMYAEGHGVTRDFVESEKWLRKSAGQGNLTAQNFLGMLYANGEAFPADYSEAIKWFRKAAEKGDPDAQNNLGRMYAKGLGVTQDDLEAIRWFRKAADQGYEKAQINLRKMSEKMDEISNIILEDQRARANSSRGTTNANIDQKIANQTYEAENNISANKKYEIQAAGNDELFIINDEKFRAKTYCLGWEVGNFVIFIEGSPLGACTSAKLYNLKKEKTCHVWCE